MRILAVVALVVAVVAQFHTRTCRSRCRINFPAPTTREVEDYHRKWKDGTLEPVDIRCDRDVERFGRRARGFP
jgi:hypothetical protein